MMEAIEEENVEDNHPDCVKGKINDFLYLNRQIKLEQMKERAFERLKEEVKFERQEALKAQLEPI